MPITLRDSARHRGRVGYNGELHEAEAGWQILGNGYRAFSPALMRFHGSDSLSPFQEGGVNGYAYARLSPVNFFDPTGHFAQYLAVGALILGFASGMAAGASHLLEDHRARVVFAAIAGGALAVAAMAGVAHVFSKIAATKSVSPPSSRGDFFKVGEVHLFRGKGRDYTLRAHGGPGTAQVGTRHVGPEELSRVARDLAPGKRIDRLQLQICYGAAPAQVSGPGIRGLSMGQGMANHLGVPTYGFDGLLYATGPRSYRTESGWRWFLPQRTPGSNSGSLRGPATRVAASEAARSVRGNRQGERR